MHDVVIFDVCLRGLKELVWVVGIHLACLTLESLQS